MFGTRCPVSSVYVRLQKERQLEKKIVRYPVGRSEIRTFSFDGRTTQWEQENVFVGRFPDRTMVGLLHSNAFNGDMSRFQGRCQSQHHRVGVERV